MNRGAVAAPGVPGADDALDGALPLFGVGWQRGTALVRRLATRSVTARWAGRTSAASQLASSWRWWLCLHRRRDQAHAQRADAVRRSACAGFGSPTHRPFASRSGPGPRRILIEGAAWRHWHAESPRTGTSSAGARVPRLAQALPVFRRLGCGLRAGVLWSLRPLARAARTRTRPSLPRFGVPRQEGLEGPARLVGDEVPSRSVLPRHSAV